MADKQNLSDIAFRNDAIRTIEGLKNDNLRLKENYGRRGNMSDTGSEVGKIKGLKGLKGKLGGQFSTGTIEDLMD